MKQKLGIPIGYSDHSVGVEICKAAVTLDANVIEKHVTLDKNQKGLDHILSATPNELNEIVEFSKLFYLSMGNGIKNLLNVKILLEKSLEKVLLHQMMCQKVYYLSIDF